MKRENRMNQFLKEEIVINNPQMANQFHFFLGEFGLWLWSQRALYPSWFHIAIWQQRNSHHILCGLLELKKKRWHLVSCISYVIYAVTYGWFKEIGFRFTEIFEKIVLRVPIWSTPKFLSYLTSVWYICHN